MIQGRIQTQIFNSFKGNFFLLKYFHFLKNHLFELFTTAVAGFFFEIDVSKNYLLVCNLMSPL